MSNLENLSVEDSEDYVGRSPTNVAQSMERRRRRNHDAAECYTEQPIVQSEGRRRKPKRYRLQLSLGFGLFNVTIEL